MNTHIITSNREDKYEMLRGLPENTTLYKCQQCRYVYDIRQSRYNDSSSNLRKHITKFCPHCDSENPILACKVDAYSIYLKLKGMNCRTGEVIAGTELCPICNDPICPNCYNHSVVSLSRVTGYVQDISGWNNGKRQELKDRQRYAIAN
jgi:rubrerythrin